MKGQHISDTCANYPIQLKSILDTINLCINFLLLSLLIANELPFYQPQHFEDNNYNSTTTINNCTSTSSSNCLVTSDNNNYNAIAVIIPPGTQRNIEKKWIRYKSLAANADWDSWWTYEGISGPDFWGRLNPKWSHCNKGKRQSPINIDTDHIIYDFFLREILIKGEHLNGYLENMGRSISITVNQDKLVLLSGGPLSYQYTLSNVTLHFGRENNRGSEHTINGVQFAGELQLYAFNAELYSNWSEARRSPNGLAAVSALIKLTKNSNNANSQLKLIANLLKNITNKGDIQEIQSLSIRELLPDTRQYVTYDGSLTQPACFETVQWIVLNKPIYMSVHQFHLLRNSLKGDGHQDNFRPIQQLNHRAIRSNIINPQLHQNQNQQRQSNLSTDNHQNRYKYRLDQYSSEEVSGDSLAKSQHMSSSSFSKELCYVSRPIAYKINQKQMDIEI